MNGNTELLNFVYKNSEMGITTIEQLNEIVKDEAFRKHLDAELKEYRAIYSAAEELLKEHGCREEGLSALEKTRTYLMLGIQTLTDRTVSHIAEIMITGSNMGILDATKKLKEYRNAESKIRELMERLLRFEENNVQRLKEFL